MSELLQLTFENGDIFRCTDFDDATSTSISTSEGRILVDITPDGKGGPAVTLEFYRGVQDWLPV